MFPFLRSADEMNRFGEETLFSRTGLLSAATSLEWEAVLSRIGHQMGGWTWRDFTPRRPICPEDAFGIWANITWRGVHSYVHRHLCGSAIDELIGSKPGVDFRRILARRGPVPSVLWRGGDLPSASGWEWLNDWKPEATNQTQGPVAALHIPQSPEDWKAFAAHAIWIATFLHSWVGGNQMRDGGNILLAPIGLRAERMPTQRTFEEIAPPTPLAGFQLALAELIGHHGWGFMEHAAEESGSHPEAYGLLMAHLRIARDELLKPEDPIGKQYSLEELKGRINV